MNIETNALKTSRNLLLLLFSSLIQGHINIHQSLELKNLRIILGSLLGTISVHISLRTWLCTVYIHYNPSLPSQLNISLVFASLVLNMVLTQSKHQVNEF